MYSIPQSYSLRLERGESQISPIFFHLEVLEKYLNDPRYEIHFDDYSGRLSGGPSEDDYIYIQSFGLAYNEKKERLLMVFLCYLDALHPHDQIQWSRFEYHEKALVAKPYYDNLIGGEWEFPMSYYSAIIEEQIFINQLTFQIFGKPLFKRTFEENKRPIEFNYLQMPTTKNFQSLVLTMDKMLSENIDKSFLEKLLVLRPNLRLDKGSIQTLIELLSDLYKVKSGGTISDLLSPWKKVREHRNKAAHKITVNEYKIELIEQRDDLVKEIYFSMFELRSILQDHPLGAALSLPERLKEKIIEI